MRLAINNSKKQLIFFAMLMFSLVVVFLPANTTFAAYQQVANKIEYKKVSHSATFTYYSGGLGVKVWCENTSGDNQIIQLQRYTPNFPYFYEGVNKTVYCGEGYYKYNYFYYPNAVSGGKYQLYFKNTGYGISTTNITAQVNPN